jgi:hypothetical protein
MPGTSPISMSATIATWAPRPSGAKAGCSFIVQNADGRHFVVTVAHIPYHVEKSRWCSSLFVWDRAAHPVCMTLSGEPGPTANLRVVASERGEPGSIDRLPFEDIVAIEFPYDAVTRTGAFESVHVVDMTAPNPPIQCPGPIVACGFPDPGAGQRWPGQGAIERAGHLFDLQWGRYIAHFQSDQGFCGAPVFGGDGAFVGMLNGGAEGDARIVPDFLIWSLVNDRPIDGRLNPLGFESAPSAYQRVPRLLPRGRIIGGDHGR